MILRKDDERHRQDFSKRSALSRAEMEFGVSADAYRSKPDQRASRIGAIALQIAFAVIAFALVFLISYLAFRTESLITLIVALIIGLLVYSSVHIALDWERCVILRGGKLSRLAGSGLFFTIPLVEYVAMRVDQRMRITPFGAEETLTSDVVPLDIDAVLLWMVWDPEKACTEVEDYCFAVALAAQTALRDAVGRAALSEVITRREQLDKQLKAAIEAKVSNWGITVLSVEVRNIIIPQALQASMTLEAQAERRKQARLTLIESERDIAEMLAETAGIYQTDQLAFELRRMHLVHEGIQEGEDAMVVPSSYTEGFVGRESKEDRLV